MPSCKTGAVAAVGAWPLPLARRSKSTPADSSCGAPPSPTLSGVPSSDESSRGAGLPPEAPSEGVPIGPFGRERRVRKRSEFQRIQSQGRRVVSQSFVFLLMRAGGPQPARLGITASRRVGCAVVRNRAKRLVREAFRATSGMWPPSLELVVIIRKSSANHTLATVVREWLRAEPKLRRRWQELCAAQGHPDADKP